jgi:hypothetical protein
MSREGASGDGPQKVSPTMEYTGRGLQSNPLRPSPFSDSFNIVANRRRTAWAESL